VRLVQEGFLRVNRTGVEHVIVAIEIFVRMSLNE